MASVRKREWEYKGEKKAAWIVNYTDRLGKRHIKTFDKKKDADNYRTKVETEISRGSHVASSASVKMDVLFDEFEKSLKAQRENGRIGEARLYQVTRTIRRHFRQAIGHKIASELTYHDIDAVADALAATKMVATTQHSYLNILAMALNFGVRRNYLSRNLVADVVRERGSGKRVAIRTFSRDDIAKLLRALENKTPHTRSYNWARLKVFVHVAAFCGLRWGEIAALRVQNIDFDASVIKVRHNLTAFGELKGPKTAAGVRDVPMPTHVAGLLQQWIKVHYKANENPERLLFRFSGKSINPSYGNFSKQWIALLGVAALPPDPQAGNFHFHALRHFAASFLIEMGLPIVETAAVLGHASFDMTLQVYAHPLVQANRQTAVMERMASAMQIEQMGPAKTAVSLARALPGLMAPVIDATRLRQD